MSTLPVWQDASANGLQHMALLLRDDVLARKVNAAPSNVDGEREDIYVEVAEKMTDLPRDELARLLDPADLARGGIKGGGSGGG